MKLRFMSQLCCLQKTSLLLNSACTKFLFSCSERQQTATRKIKFPIDVGSLRCRIKPSAVCAKSKSVSWQCGTCFWNNFIWEKFSGEPSWNVRAKGHFSGGALGLWTRAVKRQEAQFRMLALLFVLYPGVPRACLNTRAVELLLLLGWGWEQASSSSLAIYRCPILFYVVIQLHIKAIQLRRHSTNSYNPYRTTWIKTHSHTLPLSAAYNTHT